MRISDNPVVALNHAVAVAMVHGPHAGLDLLAQLEPDQRIAADRAAARDAYHAAAQRTTSLQQQRYLNTRAARLTNDQ